MGSRPSLTYWLARDADARGTLLPYVSVWRECPRWESFGKGGGWRNGPEGLQGWVCSMFPEEAEAEFGIYPRSVRSLIRVGRRLPIPDDRE